MALIIGTSGNEPLTGTAGDDVIIGGGGVHTMDGGAGNDVYYVDNAGDQVIDSAGIDRIYASVDYTLAAGLGIEYLVAYGTAARHLTGNDLGTYLIGNDGGDTLTGGTGNDKLDGKAGADTMNGGAGNDVYYVDNAGDQVIDSAGTDRIYASADYTLAPGVAIEFLVAYGTAARHLTGNDLGTYLIGNDGGDTLTGGTGNDKLDGKAGADIMNGGAGNDVYYVDNSGDQVIDSAGTDRIYASADYTLAPGVAIEYLVANGTAARHLTGNDLGTYLIGNDGDDTITGGAGNDTLDGKAGADIMTGGAGNDTYYVDNSGDQVIEATGGGIDTVYTSVNWTLGAGQEVEYLRVIGSAGLTLTGNSSDTWFFGGAGDDSIFGGSGNDRFNGGAGNDTISTEGASAIIDAGSGDDSIRIDGSSTSTGSVDGGTGNDTVHSSDLGQFTFRNVETLDTYYGYINGSVAQFASFQHYTAVLANDPGMQISISLRGAGGSLDFTTGISGQNSVETRDAGLTSGITITGSVNGDRLAGSTFNDTLKGGEGNDSLFGGELQDTLEGGAGNDLLNGGPGNDLLTGGAGNDTFAFDSPIGPGQSIDDITDFTSGTDTIQLDSAYVFAGFALGQLAAAGFSTGAATGAGPQVLYNQGSGGLFYDSDGAGAATAVQFATLTNKPTIVASDFKIV